MRIEIPDQKKFSYELLFPVRWGDMDAAGHVNNTAYFRYLETVRMEWLLGLGSLPDPQGEGPLIVNAFCNFMKQLVYPDSVRAKLYVANPGRSSFDTYITLERESVPGTIHAAGGATIVWVNFPREKSIPLPQRMRDALE
jgi:acyl-CoA thioester hydrolase